MENLKKILRWPKSFYMTVLALPLLILTYQNCGSGKFNFSSQAIDGKGGEGQPFDGALFIAGLSRLPPPALLGSVSLDVKVVMQNVGNTVWSKSRGVGLGLMTADKWGVQWVPVSDDVLPGQDIEFEFSITTPFMGGPESPCIQFPFVWRMKVDSEKETDRDRWFGDTTPEAFNIEVCPMAATPSPSPSPTPRPTASPTPTVSPTASPSPSPSPTPQPTPTPVPVSCNCGDYGYPSSPNNEACNSPGACCNAGYAWAYNTNSGGQWFHTVHNVLPASCGLRYCFEPVSNGDACNAFVSQCGQPASNCSY